MKKDYENEIFLYVISGGEYLGFTNTYQEYADSVQLFLRLNGMYETEDDLLKRLGAPSMNEVLSKCPDRFIRGRVMNEDEKAIDVWYDLWKDYFVKPEDSSYDFFFARKLRQLNSYHLVTFLNFQLEKWKDNKQMTFVQFVKLVTRSHESIFEASQIQTITEWIDQNSTQESFDGIYLNKKEKNKVKPLRRQHDGLTRFNQELTTLLFHYFQKHNVFLDSNEIENSEAGDAFYTLTGYSPNTIRQSLSENELKKIKSRKNKDEISKVLREISKQIDKDLS